MFPILVTDPSLWRAWHWLIGIFDHPDTAITALATVVIAAYTVVLARATLGTLQLLRREFDAEHRPWMGVTVEPYLPFEFRPDGTGFIYLTIGFTNTGRVPATRVRSRYEIVPPNGDPIAIQRQIASALIAESGEATEFGNSVFSGPAATQRVHSVLSTDSIAAWRKWRGDYPGKIDTTYVHVVGCATYGSPLSKARYQTGFIREIHAEGMKPINPVQETEIKIITSGSILGSGEIT